MELRQLEHFVAVADEMNFSRAALRVHIVQSALSASVAKLEKELGVELFDRSKQQIRLTPAGEVFREQARHLIRTAQSVKDSVSEYRGQLSGTVEIGGLISIAGMDTLEVLGEFHRIHPFVNIRMRQGRLSSSAYLAAIANGSMDLAILTSPGCPPPGVELRLLFHEPVRFFCPSSHPLASRGVVKLADLNREDLISTPPEFGLRQLIEDAFAEVGLAPRVRHELVVDRSIVAGLVRNGWGTTFMTAGSSSLFPDLCALPVEPELESRVYLAWAPADLGETAAAKLGELLVASSPEGRLNS